MPSPRFHAKGLIGVYTRARHIARDPMVLFLLFLCVPIIEIALFIQVGGLIGTVWTIAIILATAGAGAYFVRVQGTHALNRIRIALESHEPVSGPLLHGVLILVSGISLLFPGFMTDAMGLLLLVPPVRSLVITLLPKIFSLTIGPAGPAPGGNTSESGEGEEISASYTVLDKDGESQSQSEK